MTVSIVFRLIGSFLAALGVGQSMFYTGFDAGEEVGTSRVILIAGIGME